MNTKITPTLDRIERRLPPVSRRLFRLNRAITAATLGAVTKSARAVGEATGAVRKSATVGAKTVAGQARAEAAQTIDTLEAETVDLLDSAVDTVEDKPTGSYGTWTKSELYERAQELDIEGRSGMTKRELIGALRSS